MNKISMTIIFVSLFYLSLLIIINTHFSSLRDKKGRFYDNVYEKYDMMYGSFYYYTPFGIAELMTLVISQRYFFYKMKKRVKFLNDQVLNLEEWIQDIDNGGGLSPLYNNDLKRKLTLMNEDCKAALNFIKDELNYE